MPPNTHRNFLKAKSFMSILRTSLSQLQIQKRSSFPRTTPENFHFKLFFSEPDFDPLGECEWIHPMLKLSYSICPSTPTVEMQKAAIKRLIETMENDMEAEYGRNLKTSFELKHTILGKDTVTFIGEIREHHDSLPEIQFMLREGWEHASQEAGVKSKSECKGMEIILN